MGSWQVATKNRELVVVLQLGILSPRKSHIGSPSFVCFLYRQDRLFSEALQNLVPNKMGFYLNEVIGSHNGNKNADPTTTASIVTAQLPLSGMN